MFVLVDELHLPYQQKIKEMMNLQSGSIKKQKGKFQLKAFSLDEKLDQLLCKNVQRLSNRYFHTTAS